MEAVQDNARRKGLQLKTLFLPHYTWDKMVDILANAGGRCFGLFDELVSFFSTMNMYSFLCGIDLSGLFIGQFPPERLWLVSCWKVDRKLSPWVTLAWRDVESKRHVSLVSIQVFDWSVWISKPRFHAGFWLVRLNESRGILDNRYCVISIPSL